MPAALRVLVAAILLPRGAGAQFVRLEEERERLVTLTRDSMLLARRDSAGLEADRSGGVRLAGMSARLGLLQPELAITWNSAIPYSVNDGAMWAGRGANVAVTAGIRALGRSRAGTLRVDLAPAVLHSQNHVFDVRSDSTPGRSSYASPWHHPPFSADLPLRFGDAPLTWFTLGASGIEFVAERPRVSIGATTAGEIWGPGLRNQLVMSNNAEGFLRFFVETPGPRRTRAGLVSARLISGVLTESLFFDGDDGNDQRSLNGLLLELAPAFDTTLTFGLSRVVYRPASNGFGSLPEALARSFDVLTQWDGVDLNPPSDQDADQIISLFGRWTVPSAGLETYAEVARAALPSSVTELLTSGHAIGFTVGTQLVRPTRNGAYFRYQLELTNLEQSRDAAGQPPEFYSGQVSVHGYTHRGQVIGASVGPGGSSQFFAVDYLRPLWQGGMYTARVRTETDALWRLGGANQTRYDATWLLGVRGARRSRFTDFTVDVTYGYRLNYLFQNGEFNYGGYRTVDVHNFTIALAASPRLRLRAGPPGSSAGLARR